MNHVISLIENNFNFNNASFYIIFGSNLKTSYMKFQNSFLFSLFISGLLSSQTISIDTVIPESPAPTNSIIEYWYWAYGVNVVGSGFASNATVQLTATAPDQTKRTLTTTSDSNGNVESRFNGMKINSTLGAYNLTAVDGNGATASNNYNVIKNPLDVLTAVARPAQFKMDEFETGSLINVSGFTPNALIKINVLDPVGNGSEYNGDREIFADADGNYEFDFNLGMPLWIGNQPVFLNPTEGKWILSFSDFSNAGYIGSKTIRVLPNNPSTSSYCEVSTMNAEAITSVNFSNINNATDPNSSTSYEDFTSQVGNIERNKEYKISVKGNTNGDFRVSTFTAFIDWNQNGILDEENEIYSIGYVEGSNGMDEKFAELNITVPADAVVGNTRMRILKINSFSTFAMFWPDAACGTYFDGQIEDYTLNVKELLATNESAVDHVKFYPNPVKNILTVSTSKKVNSITAYNAAGQLVKASQNMNTIDLSSVIPGIYLIKTDVDGQIQTSKVIKK